jgi:hypothetical protein
MDTAKEHFDWCVKRANDYLNTGDAAGACASFLSDMKKHEGTKNRIPPEIAFFGMMEISNGVAAVRRWIEGFPSP